MISRTFIGSGLAGIAMCIAVPVSLAQEVPSRIVVAVSGGTLGVGPELGVRASTVLGLRASATFLGLGHDVDVDDINYHGDLKLRSYGANADLYPFANAFRLSAGFRVSRNRIDLVASPSQPVSIGGTTYDPGQIGTLEGKVRARKFAPTFTIGVAKNRRKGFAWSLDAGVMLHGRPRTYDLVATGELANNPIFEENLARERADIENEVDDYKVYPIVQLSVGYAF
jgi:hypothetical protein